jgi:hypothetical protein
LTDYSLIALYRGNNQQNTQRIQALSMALVYNTLPLTKIKHLKAKNARLPPQIENPLWIELSEPLPCPVHQQSGIHISPQEVTAFWFRLSEPAYERWCLELIDGGGGVLDSLYFYGAPSVRKWALPCEHYQHCGICTHMPGDRSPGHDLRVPCVKTCQMCEDDLRSWRNRFCQTLHFIQNYHYRADLIGKDLTLQNVKVRAGE